MHITKTALHDLVDFIEGALNDKEHATVILLDIEGVFNNINPNAIITALSNICDNGNIVGRVSATLGSTKLKRSVCWRYNSGDISTNSLFLLLDIVLNFDSILMLLDRLNFELEMLTRQL